MYIVKHIVPRGHAKHLAKNPKPQRATQGGKFPAVLASAPCTAFHFRPWKKDTKKPSFPLSVQWGRTGCLVAHSSPTQNLRVLSLTLAGFRFLLPQESWSVSRPSSLWLIRDQLGW